MVLTHDCTLGIAALLISGWDTCLQDINHFSKVYITHFMTIYQNVCNFTILTGCHLIEIGHKQFLLFQFLTPDYLEVLLSKK